MQEHEKLDDTDQQQASSTRNTKGRRGRAGGLNPEPRYGEATCHRKVRMNGKQAKRLRKAAFGNEPFHAERDYRLYFGKSVRLAPWTAAAKYRAAKRSYTPDRSFHRPAKQQTQHKNLTGIL